MFCFAVNFFLFLSYKICLHVIQVKLSGLQIRTLYLNIFFLISQPKITSCGYSKEPSFLVPTTYVLVDK